MKIQWVEEKEGNKNPHCEVEDNGEVYSFSVSRFNNTGKQRLTVIFHFTVGILIPLFFFYPLDFHTLTPLPFWP
jgi:hypothetical protein